MSGILNDLMWTEKHRPRDIGSLAMSEDHRALLESALDAGEVPHLLLHGPPGVGKTTLAFIVRDRLDCRELLLNASKERGIDVVRDRIGTFVRARMGRRWNLVILDEADQLTRDAQASLRNMMEQYAGHARFILTANFPDRILDPIRSRCTEVRMAEISTRDRFLVLKGILDAEGVEADAETVLTYANAYTDLRRMVNAAQGSVRAHGELRTASPGGSASGRDVMDAVDAGDWSAVLRISKADGTDHQALMREMFYAVRDDDPKAASRRFLIGQRVHESGFTPDPVVHFLGLCAGLMGGSA